MARPVSKKKVARLQRRFLQREGATPEEVRRYAPILKRQIGAESRFQTNLGSPAGARDIAQFMPATARSYGVTLGDNRIKDDIRGQVRMMLPMLRKHGAEGALRGYNAGEGAIERSKGFAETNAYVRKILGGKGTGAAGDGGGSAAGGGQSVRLGRDSVFRMGRKTTFDQAGFEQAQRRSLVAQMLQRRGRGGSLFRTGLLSSAAPDPAEFTSSKLVSTLTPGTNPQVVGGFDDPGGALPKGAAAKAVKAARNRLGVSEVGTSNRGERVDKWERRYGMVGQPWCGIFVGTVLRRAGVPTDSRIASVAAIETMARNREGNFGGFKEGGKGARQGDLLITRKGQHVAFIERVDRDGTIHVIGGNQSGKVTRAAHRPGTVYGTVRVRYRG